MKGTEMAILKRLHQNRPENLRKVSESQLESDTAILTFGNREIQSGKSKFCIDVMDKNAGELYRFVNISGDCGMFKNCQKVESDRHKLTSKITDNMGNGLGEFAPPCCGELMQRAICGLAYSRDRSIYRDRSYMDVALSRVGLATSKDGKVVDTRATQMQNQAERG